MTDPTTTSTTTDTEPREFGHIYTRPNSPYLWVRYRVDGVEHRESSRSTNPDVAEKLLLQRQVELGIPGAFVSSAVQRTTYEDLKKLVRAHYVIHGCRSGDRLEDSFKRLDKVFAGMRARAISADKLSQYAADRLAAGAALQTVKNELQALGQAFGLAKRTKQVAEVPEFPRLGAGPVRSGFFEPEDLRALLAELPEPLRAPIEFAYLTGWRVPSEVLPLTWAQVDFAAGMLRLEPQTTKNGEGRMFPFAALPPLASLLDRQREMTTAIERKLRRIVPLVFHRSGQPIGDFHKSWRAACTRAAHEGEGALQTLVRPALLDRIPHDLRRTAVRNLVRAGVPERTAMQLTGHLTRSVFDRYNIVDERDLADGVTKLAALHTTVENLGGTVGAHSGERANVRAR